MTLAVCLSYFQTAKELANAVIPNEYGIDPSGKLRIGSKICSSLLGKILADLANMRDESLATVNTQVPSSPPRTISLVRTPINKRTPSNIYTYVSCPVS